MTLEDIIESIKLLTVKVEAGKEKGTGVLVLQDNKLSVITVYHCIYGKEKPYPMVKNENISFKFDSKICEDEITPLNIQAYNEKIVLLEVDIDKFKSDSIPKLILLDRAYYDKSYHLRGYPKALSHEHPFTAICKDINSPFSLEIDGLTNDTSGNDIIDSVAGLSGSGVFFSENGQFYLVGLVNSLPTDGGVFNIAYYIRLVDLKEILSLVTLYTQGTVFPKNNEKEKKIINIFSHIRNLFSTNKSINIKGDGNHVTVSTLNNSFLIAIMILLVIGGSIWFYKKSQNSVVPIEVKENKEQISLKGKVFENKKREEPIPDVRVKLFIDGKYLDKKDTLTDENGSFIIKDIDSSNKIELCYEKKKYDEDYCLPYTKKDYRVYLPKK